ncbi:hypothetical protein NIES23_13820 [Trichormus variabilis NIES-23]|uniref:Glycosyltransferase RgtA/B/C/D-like domain-containing protein n=2 Tax=Nostocaceae TaxID=1162 RepID=A0A1Z4KI41_ANAVA|nr:hypothetical protein NIES23_13820 [Trichormus variabilis NIES-23]
MYDTRNQCLNTKYSVSHHHYQNIIIMFKLSSELKNLSKITLIGYSLIFLAIAVGFITRIIAVFQYVSFDIGPAPDQIKDAFTVINMWKGELPTLGPQAAVGGHHILPLYYYLFFPFTLLGASPVFQAFPNALFSFLSIPLLIYLVYQLLENVEPQTRIMLSGLAGFWYSVLYGEIFISNFQWNPSSVPFFLIAFTLLYYFQMEGKFSLPIQAICWAVYGVVLAILMSLHSSTLFVMPVVFIINCAIFIYKAVKRKSYSLITLPIISILASAIVLLPYWIGEFGRGFKNTKYILKTIFKAKSASDNSLLMSLGKRLSNLFLNYYKLFQEAYLWHPSWIYFLITLIFISLVTYLGIIKFKGNQYIWGSLCATWGIYLYAASNLDSEITYFHYKLLIVFAPIVLTITSLAYNKFSQSKKRILYIFSGIIITISCFSNLFYESQFLLSKYGSNRVMNTADMTEIISKLPSDAVLCDPRIRKRRKIHNQYNYIDSNITRQGIKLVNVCEAGNYVIHPKRLLLLESGYINDTSYEKPYYVKFTQSDLQNLWPIFKIADNTKITRPAKVFLETDTATVYILDQQG